MLQLTNLKAQNEKASKSTDDLTWWIKGLENIIATCEMKDLINYNWNFSLKIMGEVLVV